MFRKNWISHGILPLKYFNFEACSFRFSSFLLSEKSSDMGK